MTADITKEGVLLIEGQTEIESFALAQWITLNKSYNKDVNILIQSAEDNDVIEKAHG